jgi:hypothetical protein
MLPFGEMHVKHAVQHGNLGSISAFALRLRKTTENLDRVGLSQYLPDANWLLSSSPALNTQALTLVHICAVALLKNIYKFLTNTFIVNINWICTKPCTTPAEGMNKYAYKYTYICICDSWLSVNLGVYCSLEKWDVIRGLLLILYQRLCSTAKIRLTSWIVTFTLNTQLLK